MKKIQTITLASHQELNKREAFHSLYKNNPIPKNEQLSNLGLFIKRQEFSKFLFFNEVYQKILNVHGVIIEFGCRWGQNLVTFSNLRGIYEPYNYNRRIIGFDTFEGFKEIHEKDGTNDGVKEGGFSTTEGYEEYLNEILKYHESESPLSHIKKFKVIKGNAPEELENYLKKHPETIIAFAWFDFDIYSPTLKCLNLIKKHLTKGSVIGFDELNDSKFPGETEALNECLGISNFAIKRISHSPMQSYLIYE